MHEITKDEFYETVKWGNKFKNVTEKTMEDERRWVTLYSQVFQEIETEKYFEYVWEEPNTEYQEGSESDEVTVYEVEQFEETIVSYRVKKK